MLKRQKVDKNEWPCWLVTLKFGSQQVVEEVHAINRKHAGEVARGKLEILGMDLSVYVLEVKRIKKFQHCSYSLKHKGKYPLHRKPAYTQRIFK